MFGDLSSNDGAGILESVMDPNWSLVLRVRPCTEKHLGSGFGSRAGTMAGSLGKMTVWVLPFVGSMLSVGCWVWDAVAVSKSYVLGSVLASYCYLLWQLHIRKNPSFVWRMRRSLDHRAVLRLRMHHYHPHEK